MITRLSLALSRLSNRLSCLFLGHDMVTYDVYHVRCIWCKTKRRVVK